MPCHAGSYSIDILDHKSQDRLPGGPIPLAVAPGAPVAWQSAAKFGKSLSKEGILVAGAPLEVKVAVKDVHGNLWPGDIRLCTSTIELPPHDDFSLYTHQNVAVGYASATCDN